MRPAGHQEAEARRAHGDPALPVFVGDLPHLLPYLGNADARYGGADVLGLVATGRWRDPRSAARCTHTAASEEWDRIDQLPSFGGESVDLPAPAPKQKSNQ
jgi:hypothetical protein